MENILTILFSSIGIGTLVFFALKSFFKEKFKNIAKLQDIGKITNEVESVKKLFQDGTEKLKQELSVLTNKQNVLFNEEKEVLYMYLSAIDDWFNSMKFDMEDYGVVNREELNGLRKIYFEKYDKVQVVISKLTLFVGKDDIILSAQRLFEIGYIYQKTTLKYADIRYSYLVRYFEFDKNMNKSLLDDEKLKKAMELIDNNSDFQPNLNGYKEVMKPIIINFLAEKHNYTSLSKAYIRKGISRIYKTEKIIHILFRY